MLSMFDSMMKNVVAVLFASKWIHWENHWKSKGANYYGDHLLYQRMYEKVDDQVDGLMEKWMVMGNVPDMTQIMGHAQKMLAYSKTKATTPEAVSLSAERMVLKAIQVAFENLEESGELSLGLNDFLASLHSPHEENVYLLTQRNKQAGIQHGVKIPGLEHPFGNPQFTEIQQTADAGFWGNLAKQSLPSAPPSPTDILIENPRSDELSTLSRLELPKECV
jgi:DNA-binding ferritin-like protein